MKGGRNFGRGSTLKFPGVGMGRREVRWGRRRGSRDMIRRKGMNGKRD